jgi:vacuolar-type H+-ATPase subunit I/STV1
MVKMRTETTLPDGTRTMTVDEIYAKVLGVKLGYIKGCGFGPRPPPSRSSQSSINEMSEKNKELEDKLEETQHLIETQQEKIAAQNEMIQGLQEQAKKFEEFMTNFLSQQSSN